MPDSSNTRLRARSHRHLPGIELAPFAAHRHQRQERKAEDLRQRQHVDAIADAARLHQQHAALAAGPGAGEQRHALFLRRQRDARASWRSRSTRSISCECPASGT